MFDPRTDDELRAALSRYRDHAANPAHDSHNRRQFASMARKLQRRLGGLG